MARLRVEVIYALADRQERVALELEEGTTALEALNASGLLERHAELRGRELSLGVFGRLVPPARLLADGDRLEIYRPLIADPKEARRRRARRAR